MGKQEKCEGAESGPEIEKEMHEEFNDEGILESISHTVLWENGVLRLGRGPVRWTGEELFGKK